MRLAFKIAIALVVLLAAVGGVLFYVRGSLSALPSGPIQSQPKGPIALSASAPQTSVLSSAGGSNPAAYTLVSYASSNATNATVTTSLYLKNPIERIYLLNVSAYCISCFRENLLSSALESDLLEYDQLRNNTSFNFINFTDIASVPSNSIVIVPSGLMPAFMLNGTQPELLSLLQNGDTVIYAGLNFNKSIGPNGLIFVTSQQTLSALAFSNIATSQFSLPVGQQLGAAANISFSSPTFVFSGGYRYANTTYVNSGYGTLLAFSNYPTSSWTSVYSMARDIAKVVNASFWLQQVGQSSSTLDLAAKSSGNLGVFASLSVPVNTLGRGSILNGSYTAVTIAARNSQQFAVQRLVSENFYKPLGSISLPANVGITQNIPILLQVLNVSPSLLIHIDIYDQNSSYVGSIPIGFSNSPLGLVKYHAFTMPSGYYILKLKDFNNNYYGGALFHLANLSIVPVTVDFSNGTFAFSISSNGAAVSNATYTVSLNNLYESGGSIANGAVTYLLPKGTLVGYGTENFRFSILNVNYTYSTVYQPSVVNIPPIYIEFGIAAIIVIMLNLILKPPNRDEYYIDVPEFPPSKRDKVRVDPGTILGVFDKVNYYHHWKYMPLTADELKLGIGNNIRVNNMPISITMQNAESAIASLVHSGTLTGSNSYYAPKTWIDASSHSIEYLTIFRKLRDYCVSHAILFTDLDSADSADMIITKEGKQMNIFVYSSSARMRELTLSRDTKTAIVFIDEEAMREFMNKLYDSLGKEAEVLKLSIEYNYVKLLDTEHLDQLAL
ncbi:MAG: hypothetical protein KGH57_00555 [Candidatus Micrarchaeota archaeon]|nr:hypothetical protein [Candidatus Micrarchaeota archaeon]